jgi:hypothetical protein
MEFKEETLRTLYPDIEESGSLAQLLDTHFAQIGSPLRCQDVQRKHIHQFASVRVEGGSSRISADLTKRLFRLDDLWLDGVSLGSQSRSTSEEVALALHQLIVLRQNPLEFQEQFSWLQLDDHGRAFFGGAKAYTDFQWQQLEERLGDSPYPSMKQLYPALLAARAHPQLGALYPFTSIATLHFSRCTGYPFDIPCSGVCPSEEDEIYVVHHRQKARYKGIEFRGALEDAIAFIAAQLPPDCGPARQGTGETLEPLFHQTE